MDEKPPMYSEAAPYPTAQGQGPPPGQYPPPQGGQYPPQGGQYPPQGGHYPPQQGGQYPPAQQPMMQQPAAGGAYPAQTVVVTQPTVLVTPARMGPNPQGMTCPHCQANIVTSISYTTGLLAWLIIGTLCIFMIWPCCLIPFCIDGVKDVQHSCPNCNRLIGTYQRLS